MKVELKATVKFDVSRMLHVTFQKSIFLVIQVALFDFVLQTKADGTRSCTNFTYCIGSYADIYKSPTSEDNSFNIESALYPAMKPSSLVVKAQIFGPNYMSQITLGESTACMLLSQLKFCKCCLLAQFL